MLQSQLRSEIDDVTNSTHVEVQQLRSERIQRDKELSELQRQKANLEVRFSCFTVNTRIGLTQCYSYCSQDQVAEKSQLLEGALEEQVRIVVSISCHRNCISSDDIIEGLYGRPSGARSRAD